jgi:hypothetical protein
MAKLNSNAKFISKTTLTSNAKLDSMANFITSKENKEVLWNVLYNNKLFNNIPETNFNNIQILFEKTILRSLDENREILTNTISDTKNIIDLNKIILQNMVTTIGNYKKSLLTPIEIKETLKAEKLEEFDKELNAKKVSFNELITLKKPEVIDFSDVKEDDPLSSNNMNELLEKIQKERSITFPPIPPPPPNIEVVDLNEGLLIEEEKEEQISQFNAANSLKKKQNGEYMHDIHNKIDKLSSQLEQLLANQMLIMEKLNILKRE